MKLTEKQKLFCLEYLSNGFNAKKAAIDVGYSEKTAGEMGYENLNKPHLRAFIEKRLNAIKSEKIADIQEIQEFFTSIMRGELTEAEIKDRLKAAETLGKSHGMFIDRQEIKVDEVKIKKPEDEDIF